MQRHSLSLLVLGPARIALGQPLAPPPSRHTRPASGSCRASSKAALPTPSCATSRRLRDQLDPPCPSQRAFTASISRRLAQVRQQLLELGGQHPLVDLHHPGKMMPSGFFSAARVITAECATYPG